MSIVLIFVILTPTTILNNKVSAYYKCHFPEIHEMYFVKILASISMLNIFFSLMVYLE